MEDPGIIALLSELSGDVKKLVALMERGLIPNPQDTVKIVKLHKKTVRKLSDRQTKVSPLGPKWIDSLEARNILGIHRSTLYRHAKEGEFVRRKEFGRIYFLKSDIFKKRKHFLK